MVLMLILNLCVILCGLIAAQQRNPCPNVFRYESSARDEVHGIMTFKNDLSGRYRVELKMALPIRTNQKIGIKRYSPVEDVQSGRDVMFYVSFPTINPLPEVDEIIFNGQVYCSMPHSLGPQFQTLTFLTAFNEFAITVNGRPQQPEHFFNVITSSTTTRRSHVFGPELFESMYGESNTRKPPATLYTPTTTKAPVTRSPEPLDNRGELSCGISQDTQPLVVQGAATSEDQHPWLVAMFHLEKSSMYKFRCAANLITNNHVITAAHCVRHLSNQQTLAYEDITLVLGKHNIKTWATKSEIRDVKEIYVHPDYQQPADADIAIVVMDRPVVFTSKIRPVCLWSETSVSITGRQGVVIGWGRDEFFNEYVPEPKEVKIPVVSQEDCLRSDERFLRLTSNRTFCAGARDGSGVCTGDSGGGFIMRQNGGWALRGIVSAALTDSSTRSCDLNHFMVFADVAMYQRWIQRVLIRLIAVDIDFKGPRISNDQAMVLLIFKLFAMILLGSNAHPLPRNPCPNVFRYESSASDKIHGIVTLKNDLSGSYKLDLKMILPIQTSTNQNIAIERLSSLHDAESGKDIVFYVTFPRYDVIPEVGEIVLNGRVHCSMVHTLGSQFQSLTFLSASNMFSVGGIPSERHPEHHTEEVTHTLEPGGGIHFFNFESPGVAVHKLDTSDPESFFVDSRYPTKEIIKPELETHFFDFMTTSTTESNVRYSLPTKPPENVECGIAEDTQSLVVHGKATSEGQYPWLVAMFHLQENSMYKFRCGGNLITNSHVLTAAHCVRRQNKQETIPHEDITLVLGKHNIKTWATRSKIRAVREIYVHPDYRRPSDADIAIVAMDRPVEYTSKIRPVCLGGEVAASIAGKQGTVVGWGRDEFFNEYVPEPREVKMPVVSQEDCLRSDERFLALTSTRTFCAGTRNGTGACTGDSGGGFVVKQNGRWTLRGIVSSALQDSRTKSCDLNNYMVFSDVGSFNRWIQNVLVR
ncbi:serine protease gd-like [Photinus pyralis]|nr:serine protease gd-like [Photinus pyralis]